MFVAELVDPNEELHLRNSASGFPNDLRSYVAPFGAIKFHDSSRARLKRLEIVYERVVALFDPLNDVVIWTHGGSSRVCFEKHSCTKQQSQIMCQKGPPRRINTATPATDLCTAGDRVGGHLLRKQQPGVSKESPKLLNNC